MEIESVLHRVMVSVERYPDRTALEIGERECTYSELWSVAGTIAEGISQTKGKKNTPVALFASRSFATYAGILGILLAGRAYLPMNLRFPISRAVRMLQLSGCDTVLISDEFKEYFRRIDVNVPDRFQVIQVKDNGGTPVSEMRISMHKTLAAPGEKLSTGDRLPSLPRSFSETAYLLFTSGTTGEPKGIPVGHTNLNAYLDYISTIYDIGPNDRCSQAFDTTFDPSVHDIFVCFSAGSCLCPLSINDLLLPNHFITKKRLTVWYSVPSIALRMKQVRMLKPASFPLLRYSFFSGEALPDHLAADWKKAANRSKIVNYYGPTEVTINITEYEWIGEESSALAVNGVVPIGKVYPTHRYAVVGDSLEEVQRGKSGELLVSGPQVTSGYLNRPEKTAENYIRMADDDVIWYRTGDRVIELEDGTLQFLGRIDHQIQIRGFRVEATEVESVLRRVPGVVEAIVLPIEENGGVVSGLHAFLLSHDDGELREEAMRYCLDQMPEYMVPKRFTILDKYPVTVNGKIDRKQLSKMENESDI